MYCVIVDTPWCIIVVVLAGGKRDVCLHDANELWRRATTVSSPSTVSPANSAIILPESENERNKMDLSGREFESVRVGTTRSISNNIIHW